MSTLLIGILGGFLLCLMHALTLEGWISRIRSRGVPHATDVPMEGMPFISVIIPARDAANTLVPLLQDLHAQRYPRDRFEVFVVDDHSSDGTAAVVDRMRRQWPALHLVRLQAEEGKKPAITRGVEEVVGEIVLLTDADVRCGPDRLQTMALHWRATKADLMLLPVVTAGGEGILSALQQAEQLALQGATAGSALSGSPVLANGANLAFTVEAFRKVGGYAGDRWASGDDVFLLQRMRRAHRKVSFVQDPEACVVTGPERSWPDFVSQRIRWSGKMRGGRDGRVLLAGVLALFLPWSLVALTTLTAQAARSTPDLFYATILLIASWSLWTVPVLRLVRTMDRFFAQAGPWSPTHNSSPLGHHRTVAALLAFVIYAPLIAVLSLIIRPRWRGRRL